MQAQHVAAQDDSGRTMPPAFLKPFEVICPSVQITLEVQFDTFFAVTFSVTFRTVNGVTGVTEAICIFP